MTHILKILALSCTVFMASMRPVTAQPASLQSAPILVLATDEKFGSFTCEILKTEGFNEARMDSLTDRKITLTYLRRFDIVILAEVSLTNAESEMLTAYVQGGGNLVAFRPDRKLSRVFGLGEPMSTIADGYISVLADGEIGRGITNQSLQFHGEADRYKLRGAKAIAALSKEAVAAMNTVTSIDAATFIPAVVINDYGKGHGMAFLYNLPQSIVYTRQGNYRDAGKERDGIIGIRAMDLFTNGWVDTTRNLLNQADEQMRLLSHGLERMSSDKRPLPRFWYFPDTLKCLVTLNNDGEDSKEDTFTPQFGDVEAKGAKMTLYVKETGFISKGWIDEWVGRGFEISGHPDDTRQAGDPDWKTMDSVYKNIIGRLRSEYNVDGMRTTVNHWFVWCGRRADGTNEFAAQALIEEQNGIGLDCNYAHYDNGSTQGHFLGSFGTNQGNYTGSGLVMKFAGQQGKRINVYQQLNNVYDQQYMEHKDPEGYYNCFRGLMDRSLDDEVYSYVCIKAHNDEYYFSKGPLMRSLDYANARGIPVWTEQKLLGFLRSKDEAVFDGIRWKNDQLSFRIRSTTAQALPQVPTDTSGLTCMIPDGYGGKRVRAITVDGVPQAFSVKSIKGFDYAWLIVKPGSGHSIVVNYLK